MGIYEGYRKDFLSQRMPLIIHLVPVLLVNCEKISESVKILHLFELLVQEKNLHKKQSFRLSMTI